MEYKFIVSENCLGALAGNVVGYTRLSSCTNSSLIIILLLCSGYRIIGDKWRHRRRLLTPAFHFKILDGFISTFNEKSMASAAKMEEILGPSAGSKEIDVFPIMVKMTFDAISTVIILLYGSCND
jgi:cytochrome P450